MNERHQPVNHATNQLLRMPLSTIKAGTKTKLLFRSHPSRVFQNVTAKDMVAHGFPADCSRKRYHAAPGQRSTYFCGTRIASERPEASFSSSNSTK